MATTSNLFAWMICSIASICSGTDGHPKCRSETWKTVVTSPFRFCFLYGAITRSAKCVATLAVSAGEKVLIGLLATSPTQRI
jgi:hypothetical protein